MPDVAYFRSSAQKSVGSHDHTTAEGKVGCAHLRALKTLLLLKMLKIPNKQN